MATITTPYHKLNSLQMNSLDYRIFTISLMWLGVMFDCASATPMLLHNSHPQPFTSSATYRLPATLCVIFLIIFKSDCLVFTQMSLHLHCILVMLFSGLIVLFMLVDNLSCIVGMYVMVIGAYIAEQSKDNYPAIKVPSPSLTLSSLSVFLNALFP